MFQSMVELDMEAGDRKNNQACTAQLRRETEYKFFYMQRNQCKINEIPFSPAYNEDVP